MGSLGGVMTLVETNRGYCPGQAISQHFMMMLENCEQSRRLGKTPLTVENCSPGVQVVVTDPLREGYWLGPDMDVQTLTERFVCDQMDDCAVRDRFLSGQLKLRAKCWQISNDEVVLLSNKPTRRIITVRLKRKGDTITFRNEEGVPFALTR